MPEEASVDDGRAPALRRAIALTPDYTGEQRAALLALLDQFDQVNGEREAQHVEHVSPVSADVVPSLSPWPPKE